MYLYLWEYLEQVSNNYHPEGGLVVVAKDVDDAKAQIAAYRNIQITEDEWKGVRIYELDGEVGYPFVEPQRRVFVFPDAGCC